MKKLVALMSICVLVSGCSSSRLSKSQKTQLQQFSVAATILNRYAGDEFKTTRDTVIKLNKLRQFTDTTWPIAGGLDGVLDAQEIIARQEAVKSLEQYSILLYALVTDQEDQTLRATAVRFTDSLRRLEQSAEFEIPGPGKDIIEKTIAGIGRIFIERAKFRAVKDIVGSSKPYVDSICELIIQDFEGDYGLTAQLVVTATSTLLSADTFLRGTRGLDGMSNIGRVEAAEAYDQASLAIDRHGIVHHRIATLAKDLKTLNKELNDSIQKRGPKLSFESMSSFRIGVERLVEDAKFYVR